MFSSNAIINGVLGYSKLVLQPIHSQANIQHCQRQREVTIMQKFFWILVELQEIEVRGVT